MQAAKYALIERLRRRGTVLDTLLVSSLSPELGPDDIAAALRLNAHDAQRLVDRPRQRELIEPSHSEAFLRSVHLGIAAIIGAARHHDIEIALLRSQIELIDDTVVGSRAADGRRGLRDDRLANALADLATQHELTGGRKALPCRSGRR